MNESMPPPNHRSALGVPPSARSLESTSPLDMETNSTGMPLSLVNMSNRALYDSLVHTTWRVLSEEAPPWSEEEPSSEEAPPWSEEEPSSEEVPLHPARAAAGTRAAAAPMNDLLERLSFMTLFLSM